MGKNQKMICHYEILGIERDSTDDEIKKSYRKLALKYHPDKNPENLEECTKHFLKIQQAYEVLIDPQERAWYDKHREAILKGGLGRGDDYQDDSLDVYQYFNTSCFTGYGDDDEGFYAVYSKVFKDLSEEEYEFMDERESDWEIPEFGKATSSYEEVVDPFYDFWENFCTTKSYVWAEKYDTREAPNRQVRRAMEKENKKLTAKARKERNDEVRALVGFVKKRDRRVKAYKKLKEEEAAEKKRLQAEKQKLLHKERQIDVAKVKEAQEAAMREMEADFQSLDEILNEEFGHDDDYVLNSEDEEEVEEFFCVACNKAFRTEKSLGNHEKSKKHKERVAILKQMLEEEDLQMADFEEADSLAEKNATQLSSDQDNLDMNDDLPDDDIDDNIDELLDDLDLEAGVEEATPKTKLSKKQKKMRRKHKQFFGHSSDVEYDEESVQDSTKNEIRAHAEQSSQYQDEGPISAAEKDEVLGEGMGDESTKLSTESDESKQIPQTSDHEAAANLLSNTVQSELNEIGEKMPEKKKKQPQPEVIRGPPQNCNVCQKSFSTRNKLFQHIKQTGHALRVEQGNQATPTDTKAKKGKKKKGKK